MRIILCPVRRRSSRFYCIPGVFSVAVSSGRSCNRACRCVATGDTADSKLDDSEFCKPGEIFDRAHGGTPYIAARRFVGAGESSKTVVELADSFGSNCSLGTNRIYRRNEPEIWPLVWLTLDESSPSSSYDIQGGDMALEVMPQESVHLPEVHADRFSEMVTCSIEREGVVCRAPPPRSTRLKRHF